MLVLLHSTIDREKHESISSWHYMEIRKIHSWQHAPLQSMSHSEKVKDQLHFVFSVVYILQSVLSKKDSVINTFAITAVTKSFMKPWSGAISNCHLRGKGERNGKQIGRTMMQALELLRWQKSTSWDKATLNQAHSHSGYWIMLVWRHRSVR